MGGWGEPGTLSSLRYGALTHDFSVAACSRQTRLDFDTVIRVD
jgi:hypothetical protein